MNEVLLEICHFSIKGVINYDGIRFKGCDTTNIKKKGSKIWNCSKLEAKLHYEKQ
jgi:hypothetical protein